MHRTETMRLTNGILEGLASLEGWDLHRWDADLLGWVAWVHARASAALGNAERAEARDRHVVTLLEFFRDRTDESLKSVTSSTLGDAGSIGNDIDEVLLGHRRMGEEVIAKIVLHRNAAASQEQPKNPLIMA